MYRYTETITQTNKFKKLLAKLNLDTELDTQFAISNLGKNRNPTMNPANGFKDINIKNPALQYLTQVKEEVQNYGHIYEDIEKAENDPQRQKLPRLIFRNFNKKNEEIKKNVGFLQSGGNLTAAKKHEMYRLAKIRK